MPESSLHAIDEQMAVYIEQRLAVDARRYATMRSALWAIGDVHASRCAGPFERALVIGTGPNHSLVVTCTPATPRKLNQGVNSDVPVVSDA
jgi:hypothetical protein